MVERISPETLNEALGKLDGWEQTKEREAIRKTFTFKDFREAFAWMTHIAFIAESMNHHPEWFNVHSRIEVTLATHDVGGVTELDLTLAQAMDAAHGPA